MNTFILGIISSISAILASMGIGGGALFVLISTLLLNAEQKYAQTLNLFLFITSSIAATIFNSKNKMIKKDVIKQSLPLIFIGAIFGTMVFEKIDSYDLKIYFNIFLLIIGIYEIISSLIKIKKDKNINGQ